MAFFMVMFALSQVDAKKFKSLALSLGEAFNSPGVSPVHGGIGQNGRMSLVPKPPRPSQEEKPDETKGTSSKKPKYESIDELKAEFKKLVKASGLEGSVTVGTNAKGDRLIVRLSDSLLFAPGSADLTGPAQDLMDKVAAILLQTNKRIRIEGHTDNVPISNWRYKSNWQLSTERATNVLMYLVQDHGLPPESLEAGGCGEYRPVADNATSDGKAKNRRVEFVILDEDDTKDSTIAADSGTEPAAAVGEATTEVVAPVEAGLSAFTASEAVGEPASLDTAH